MGKYQKNIEAARRISVVQYLETYHPGELVRKTDKEYCTKTHSSLVITPANGLFHWFSQSKGGNNALDYLVKVEGMDFVSAVRLLNEMTPMPVSVQTVKEAPVQQQTSRPFVLLYDKMLLDGTLYSDLKQTEQRYWEQVEQTITKLLVSNPAPDKNNDPLGWTAHMNNLQAQAAELAMPIVTSL